MHSKKLRQILASLKKGRLDIDEAVHSLKDLPYEDLGFARVDHHRGMRQGIPEVIYAEGKRPEEILGIARAMHKKSGRVLITRAEKSIASKLRIKDARFHENSGIITAGGAEKTCGKVLVITAGTSDIPVAEEAAVTAGFLGSAVETVFDAGVAGIHRLMDQRDRLAKARAIVVVAGMEGALPSVVGGLTERPIIAVPTSVGYGTSLGGLTALFAMLNSCVPGIAVMNIDNGFGAGCLAHKINTMKK
jgi:NCAIR mutase (PurE)-related protein